MKLQIVLFFILTMNLLNAQEVDSLVIDNDTTVKFKFKLEDIIVTNNGIYELSEEEKQRLILRRRVYKTFPYAKLASEKLVALNTNLALLKTEKEKKKYFKIVENYLEDEFEAKLKKLSKKDGQILVKLIHRQTGISTYELIRELKSGWKAFWSNSTAKLFDINLKTIYDPYNNLEDFNIESILLTAFEEGSLAKQEAKNPVDLDKLLDIWTKKIEETKE